MDSDDRQTRSVSSQALIGMQERGWSVSQSPMAARAAPSSPFRGGAPQDGRFLRVSVPVAERAAVWGCPGRTERRPLIASIYLGPPYARPPSARALFIAYKTDLSVHRSPFHPASLDETRTHPHRRQHVLHVAPLHHCTLAALPPGEWCSRFQRQFLLRQGACARSQLGGLASPGGAHGPSSSRMFCDGDG